VNDTNTMLFYATAQYNIKIYDLEKNYIIKTLKGHTDTIWVLKISKDQKYLLSGGNDRSVMIWDLENNYKLVHKISYGVNIYTLAMGPLNRSLYLGGSKYKPIKKFNLKNVLKSSISEFNKFLVSKKKSQEFYKQKKQSKLDKDTKRINIPVSQNEILNNSYVKQILNNYDDWILTFNNQDQMKIKEILINSALLQEQYSKLKVKIEKKSKSDVLRANENSNECIEQNQLNMMNKSNFTLGNTDNSNESIKSDLVELIKKHNLLLNEKKILINIMKNTKNHNEFLEIQSKQNNRMIQRLSEENTQLKMRMKEFMIQNKKINDLMKIKIDKNKLLKLKTGRMNKNIQKLQNQLKLYKENFKSDINKSQLKNINLKEQINVLKERQKEYQEIENTNMYQSKYIHLLEIQNSKLKSQLSEGTNESEISTQNFFSLQVKTDKIKHLNTLFNRSTSKAKFQNKANEEDQLNETSEFIYYKNQKQTTLKKDYNSHNETSDSLELKKTIRFDIPLKEKPSIQKK
jgi:WD40 repeat protein